MVVHCGKSEAATLGRVLWRFAIRFGRIKGPLVREDKAVVLERHSFTPAAASRQDPPGNVSLGSFQGALQYPESIRCRIGMV